MKLLSWNILRAGERGAATVAREIAAVNADIVLIQEALEEGDSAKQFKDLAESADYEHVAISARHSKTFTNGVMSHDPFKPVFKKKCFRKISFPYRILEFSHGREAIVVQYEGLTVATTHFQTDMRIATEQATALVKGMKGYKGNIIIGGDFNALRGAPAYQVMIDAGYMDDTITTSNSVDHVFSRGGLVVKSAERIPTTASDHQIVVIDYE